MDILLSKLLELNLIDRELLFLNESKGDLPADVNKLEIELSDLNENKIKNKNEIEGLTKKIDSINNNLEDSSIKVKKLQEQLFQVTNNKQYDALNSEIDFLKNEMNSLKEESAVFINQKDNLKEENEQINESINTSEKKLNLNRDELSKADSQSKEEEASLINKRNQMIKDFNINLYNDYEKIRKAKGIAMANINRSSCESCYSTLPQQTVIEVKKMESVVRCPFCNIFLYHDGNE